MNKNLVEKAKAKGINLSHFTEQALKKHLFPYLSLGETIAIDFERYLKDLINEKRCFLLPFKLKKIKMTKIAPIANIELDLGKTLIVVGKNETGKTVLIKSIMYFFGGLELQGDYFFKNGSSDGEIYIETFPRETTHMKIDMNKLTLIDRISKDTCMLLDGPGDVLEYSLFREFILFLKELGCQIIMTTNRKNEEIIDLNNILPECRIFRLE